VRVADLAIHTISTHHPSLDEALDGYAAAGFRRVEVSLREVKGWLDGRPPSAFAGALDDRGLRCVGGLESVLQCFADEESRRANLELHVGNARLLHELGGGVLTVGTDGPEQRSVEALDQIAARFRELAAAIEGLDVRVALEFNWSPIVKSLDSAYRVVAAVDHPQVGILFDPAHYRTTMTKFEDLTPDRTGRVVHVHLNDMRDIPADLSDCNADRVLPGEGVLDLPVLIGALEAGGYGGSYSIEMFNRDLWELPAAETARRCYRSLLPLCVDGQ
jgi:4-hydroxyphenylpyruvate dioxygenase